MSCKKYVLFFFVILLSLQAVGQESSEKQSLTLMFIGDLMGHGAQIESAYNPQKKTYCYNDVFSFLPMLTDEADITIANLEVTLGGEPYKGYPQFSSPDEFADAIKGFGVDYLVTANNHTVDRGKKGIIRTIDVLDKKNIPFAGAYKDQAHRDSLYPLIIEKNGFRLALLNYTYGTNGIPVPTPTIVNLIDTALIRADYTKAIAKGVDEVIAFMHWGEEYKLSPSRQQIMLTNFMHNLGIRLVIGSHPHVIQRMEASFDTDTTEGRVVVYSLGNFVSNIRNRYTDGGVISTIELVKENGKTRIANAGYILVWVQTPVIDGNEKFRVLPVSQFEQLNNELTVEDVILMNRFASDSRKLFNLENYNFPEITYKHDRWIIPWKKVSPIEPIPTQIINSSQKPSLLLKNYF